MPKWPSPPGTIASLCSGRKSRRLLGSIPHRVRVRTVHVRSPGKASHPAAASRPDSSPSGHEGRMRLGGLLLIQVDPLVDLIGIGAVVSDSGLHQAKWHLEVARRLGEIAIVVADGGDDYPDILASPQEPGTAAGRAFGEPDQRMLIHRRPIHGSSARYP